MTLPSTQPRPRSDSSGRGQHEPGERVALAMSPCSACGAQRAETRRLILELLRPSDCPKGVCELIEILEHRVPRPAGPPAVCRTPEFPMSQGLLSKTKSRNAHLPCAHSERRHECLIFMCNDCEASAELEDSRVAQLYAENAAVFGCRVTRCVVEVEGTCASCIAAGAA